MTKHKKEEQTKELIKQYLNVLKKKSQYYLGVFLIKLDLYY